LNDFFNSSVVLQLQNAGKPVHRVNRLLSTIENIRDRTMHVAAKLMSSTLQIQAIDDGVALRVDHHDKKEPKQIEWRLSNYVTMNDEDSLVNSYRRRRMMEYFETVSFVESFPTPKNYSKSSRDVTVAFPVLLLHGEFDPFAVVHTPQIFKTFQLIWKLKHHITDSGESSSPFHRDYHSRCGIQLHCAEEVWDFCHSSGHTPGQPLPIPAVESMSEIQPNMILPLAHTPVLYHLYLERGRIYHSAINITGDCSAVVNTSTLQWAKFFHDALLRFTTPTELPSKVVGTCEDTEDYIWFDTAMKSLVSLSYALKSYVLAPSLENVELMFGKLDSSSCEETNHQQEEKSIVSLNSTKKFSSVKTKGLEQASDVVISREMCPGINCATGFALLISLNVTDHNNSDTKEDRDLSCQPKSWSLLTRTIYSRMCESISGIKIIRYNNPDRRDPGELEENYRLLLGRLQTVLKKRLHLEWKNLSKFDKLDIISQNSAELIIVLRQIVEEYLNQLHHYKQVTWRQMVQLLSQSIVIRNYGLNKIKNMLCSCESLQELFDIIRMQKDSISCSIILPCYEYRRDSMEICMKELSQLDHDEILLYIESIIATKAVPKHEYKPIINPTFPQFTASKNRELDFNVSLSSWDNGLVTATIVFIGNVNMGKSSISGRILSDFKLVPESILARLGDEAMKLGYSSDVKLAWLCDVTSDERRTGYSILPTFRGFQSNARKYHVIDAPGHKDFIKNAAFAIYHADVCVVVVSALKSEMELADISSTGRSQMMEHLITVMIMANKAYSSYLNAIIV
jgi:hypothetical protein